MLLPDSLIILRPPTMCFSFFFFNDTATTEIYTLSLHDALPISQSFQRFSCLGICRKSCRAVSAPVGKLTTKEVRLDRKSTRLNSSHGYISYAVFCLKKKKKKKHSTSVTINQYSYFRYY